MTTLTKEERKEELAYMPKDEELKAQNKVLRDFEKGRSVASKGYNQFNGRNLQETIDDWTKRWNGFIPESNPLLENTNSHIFLNFTRNAIISYLAKVAVNAPKADIVAVNRKTNLEDERFAEALKTLNQYSLNEENAPTRFFESALECATKGTIIKYEGYARYTNKVKVPKDFDPETGEVKYEEVERIEFDNCYQETVALEDFFIANPYEPDIQKQQFVIWRKITSYDEGEREYGHYPNYQYVKKGVYTIATEPSTFYRNDVTTQLLDDQVEILRYFHKADNKHIVMINGVVVFNGAIPFKDGKYPFAKGIHEPYDNFFFWGAGYPQKIMGEQDLQNTFINLMADKTFNSLMPTGLTSDLDDVIEDNVIQIGKLRHVGDVNNWKWWEAPDVTSAEQNMFNTILNLGRENSGSEGGASAYSPQGGKLQVRQVMLKQQEALSKIGFNANLLEDFERDRTILRVNHILQFYSIPKIEKITGKRGKEVQQMVFREIRLSDQKLKDGRTGERIVKLIDNKQTENPDERQKMADNLSVMEAMGEEMGNPTEALAVSVDTFYDYDLKISIVKNSSQEKNQVLEQAMRHEYANWRVQMAQLGVQTDFKELVKWVDEAYEIDSDRFEPKTPQMPQGQQEQPPQGQMPQPSGGSMSADLNPAQPMSFKEKTAALL